MSDHMNIISFPGLINWIFAEYNHSEQIFGIFKSHFYKNSEAPSLLLLEDDIETPLGPAAGPHTQLAQNLVCAYLTGGRFFELKTVQILDELEIDKPCIDARDEGYNVEWSQELKLHQSYEEYIKAWFILHLLKDLLELSLSAERGFIFNMSVGYDLKGIQTKPMDQFINNLKDASKNELFNSCRNELTAALNDDRIREILKNKFKKSDKHIQQLLINVENVSPGISNSVTLSTMHGCPPDEIESISKYLIRDKGLHTYIKLNPTLLGYDQVQEILNGQGYNYIQLDPAAFDHDLQYGDALPMIQRLQQFADQNNRQFGVKLSNTLGVANPGHLLAGGEMYMSGRALFPLTINLAAKLADAFDGKLKISYSGGASVFNIESLVSTGIFPVTLATDLLKPGGYSRLFEMAGKTRPMMKTLNEKSSIHIRKIKQLAEDALFNPLYHKSSHDTDSIKTGTSLEKFDCYISPCQEACPIHQDIPEYIRLMEAGRPAEAFETIIQKNPLPHITGFICDHQCMSKCVRWDYDTPLLIRDIKKAAAETGYSDYMIKFNKSYQQKPNGIQVAVIGAGPAGLSAAYFLAKQGFEVTVFEKEQLAGGTVQHIIPDFRLTREAIQKDIEFIEDHGVKFQYGVDEKFSIETLKNSGFKYIFIGIGAMQYSRLTVEGDQNRILNAVEFLKEYKQNPEMNLGKHIAVIGGGNSAMDGARAALRCKGTEKVYIIYRRTIEYMPADKEELEAALHENVEFKELLLPLRFSNGVLTCQKMKLGEPEKDGRRSVAPVNGESTEVEIDTVISAIGEQVDMEHLITNHLAESTDKTVKVHPETRETVIEGVYLGGDAYRGPATVVEAIADGKRVAEDISRKEQLDTDIFFNIEEILDISDWQNNIINKKPLQLAETPDDIVAEAARCLGCKYLCNKCVDVCPNRANVAITVQDGFADRFQILHLDDLCNECGNCETFCPHIGAPYREKVTLFSNEEDFINSKNDGFLPESLNSRGLSNFKIRFDGKVGFLTYSSVEQKVFSSLENNQETFLQFNKLLIALLKDYQYLM